MKLELDGSKATIQHRVLLQSRDILWATWKQYLDFMYMYGTRDDIYLIFTWCHLEFKIEFDVEFEIELISNLKLNFHRI